MEKRKRRHLLNKPIIFSSGISLGRFLPRFLTYRIAEATAILSYLICAAARRSLKENLALVLPSASKAELRRLSLKTFINYSRYIIDYSTFSDKDGVRVMKEINRIEGTERIYEALGMGNGIILVTPHLGNWELGGFFFGNRDDINMNVITFRDGIDEIDEIKERYRKLYNVNTIVVGEGPFASIEILNALGRNEIVAMLVDRGVEDGVEVPFFGKKVSFPTGALTLAAVSGAPIMPGFVVREEGGYSAIIEELIHVDKSEEKGKERAAQKTIEVFEKYIRKYPDQWYNFTSI